MEHDNMTTKYLLNHYSDAQILKAVEMIVNKQYTRGTTMTGASVAREYCQRRLVTKDREHFLVILLDNKNQLLHQEVLFKGTIDQVSVYPREVVRYALKHNASALLVAHNHPSGDSVPSQADQTITSKLKEALSLLDMRLLDHIVVGASQTTSMAEQGFL